MIERDFESLARSIVGANQRARAEAKNLSARLASVLLSGTQESLDEFNNELAREIHELSEGPGEDPATSGTDGGAADASDS